MTFYKNRSHFFIFIILLTSLNSQIFPDSDTPNDYIFLDDILNSNELFHWIVFSYRLNQFNGYRDERRGIYYQPNLFCGITNYYIKPLLPATITSITTLNQYTEELYIMGKGNPLTNPTTPANNCDFKLLYDDPTLSMKYTIRMRFRNSSNKASTTDLLFYSSKGTTFLIDNLTFNIEDVIEYTVKVYRENSQLKFYKSGDNFSVLYSTPLGATFYDNTNFGAYSFGIRFVKNPNNMINGDIMITSVIVTSNLPNGVRSTSGSFTNSCSFGRVCIPGTYCDILQNACRPCDYQCKDCFSGQSNACKSCFPTSPDFDKIFAAPQKCTFDYIDLSKYENFNFLVPPAINFRVTFEFWFWIHDTTKFYNSNYVPAFSIIYKDFMTIAIFPNSNNIDIDAVCYPMELNYSYDPQWTKFTDQQLFDSTVSQKVKTTYTNISSKWQNFRCAFSIDHMEMYVNNLLPIALFPPIHIQGYSNFPHFLKKFYDLGDYTNMYIQGHRDLYTEFYIKNLNIFSEYLPQGVETKWWDLSLITTYLDFPELIFVAPFADLTQDGSTGEGTVSCFDYSNLSNTPKNTISISMKFFSNYLVPSKNFRRLKLLPLNNIYSNNDLTQYSNLICSGNHKFCFGNNQAFACQPGSYLDILTFSCQVDCPVGYTRLPRPREINNSGYCNYSCPSTGCATIGAELVSIDSFFNCNPATEYLNYFNCVTKSTTTLNTSIQFSGKLNTKSIEITLPTPESSIIISIWMHPDLSNTSVPPLKKSYFFMTDVHHFFYDNTSQKFVSTIGVTGSSSDYEVSSGIYFYGWNHIILYNQSTSSSSNIYYANDNNFFSKSSLIATTNVLQISKICFCNNKTGGTCCNSPAEVYWMDMFYKKLRIFNGNRINVWSVIQFENFNNDNPKSLVYYFPFTIDSIQHQIIKDIYQNVNGVFPSDNYIPTFNIDKNNMFNYAWNFSWNDLNPGKFANSILLTGSVAVPSGNDSCDTSCSVCYGKSSQSCLACNGGYGLSGNTCKIDSTNGEMYYIKSPSSSGNDISLSISSLNIDTYESITIFLFVKMFGFKVGSTNDNIIIFNSTERFILRFRESNQSLNVIYNDIVQFSYENFQSEFLGRWTPISIAMYRSNNPLIFPHMNSVTIHYKTLAPLDLPSKSFQISELTISNNYIGLLSNIIIYKNFIVNAWGFASHYTSNDVNLDYQLFTFPLKSNTNTDCIKNSDLSSGTISSLGIICVSDYNPFYDQTCEDNEGVYVDKESFDAVSCEKCICSSQCLSRMTSCDLKLISCENRERKYIDYLLYIDPIDKFISCGNHNGLDFNRYNELSIPNISSPKGKFKLEFWYYYQSYVGNNFKSITITWDFHLKINVYYNSISNTNDISCIPIPSYSSPSNDPQASFASHGNANIPTKWLYVVCGVDSDLMQFYVSNGFVPDGTSFSTKNSIPSNTVNLFIKENSITSFGITYIREMRLWNCYDCNVSLALSEYSYLNIKFQDVLHVFQFFDPKGFVVDNKTPSLELLTNIKFQCTERGDYKGSNIIYPLPGINEGGASKNPTGKPPNCYESEYEYYDLLKSYACDKMYNLNILQDFTFEKVPSVNTGRYQIDFWIYIESPNDFTKGMNIIYDDHISINIYSETISSEMLIITCFPQGYKVDIKGKDASEVNKIYYNIQNKVKDGLPVFSQWTYVSCGLNNHDEFFFLNNKVLKLQSEYFYNTQTLSPMRHYPKEYSSLTIENASINHTRIFIQTINIFRDTLPNNITLRHRNMKFYMGENFFPLLFSVNFDDYSTSYNGLQWFYSDWDNNFNSNSYVYNLLTNIKTKEYKTYPVYIRPVICNVDFYYNSISNSCEENTISKCDEKTVYCYSSETTFFWCPKGKFLNIQTLTCNTDCPLGYTRYPNTSEESGFCNFKCDENNVKDCPSQLSKINYINYNKTFKCIDSMYRFYYKCQSIQYKYTEYFYFNSYFSFENSISTINNDYNEYIIEAWILLDQLYSSNTENRKYYYLIPYPIGLFIENGKLKYMNFKAISYISASSKELVIENFNFFEWNRIFIKCEEIFDLNIKRISIFMNNKLDTPSFTIDYKPDLAKLSIKGLVFCNNLYSNKANSCNIDNSFMSIYWGSAFYRKIAIYNLENSSISYAIERLKGINDNMINVISEYDLRILSLNDYYIKEQSEFRFDYSLYSSTKYNNQYDNDKYINYVSLNSFYPLDEGYYFDSVTDSKFKNYTNTNSFLSKPCSKQCKKCFNSEENSCYECMNGYILNKGVCVERLKTYLKIPLEDNLSEETLLNSVLVNENISLLTPITIMFWMKLFGIPKKNKIKDTYTILGLFDENNGKGENGENLNFLGLNTIDNSLCFFYQKNKIAFSSFQNEINIYGRWVHIGISIYNAIEEKENPNIPGQFISASFPNMLNLMIDTKMISKRKEFNTEKEYIYINKLSFGNEISFLVSELQIHHNFYIGTYGFAQNMNRNQSLLYEFSFIGNDDKNCIKFNEIVNVKYSDIDYGCLFDNNEYSDVEYQCNSSSLFRNISLFSSPKCSNCDSSCEISCYSQSNKTCSCSYNQKRYWIREDTINTSSLSNNNISNYTDYYCEEVPSINFAYYQPVVIDKIKPGGIEYMIEVWIYVYEYVNNKFPGGDIVWDRFSRVKIISNNNGDLNFQCYPYADIDFLDSRNTFYVDVSGRIGEWMFIRCKSKLSSKTVSINDKEEKIFLEFPTIPYENETKLLIRDYAKDESYGVFLIRELRLWNAPNYLFYDTARIRLDPNIYTSLVHYFINSFDDIVTIVDNIYDSKSFKQTKLKVASQVKGYNYIKRYKTLILCKEGETFVNTTSTCKELTLEDILNSIDLGAIYQPTELLIRARVINSLTKYKYDEGLYRNISLIVPNYQSKNLTLNDPIVNKKYCHSNGDALIIDRFLSCSCFNGFTGTVCQMKESDYPDMLKIYRLFAAKIWQTSLIDQSDIILQAIYLTVSGSNRFLKDVDWTYEMMVNVTGYYNKLPYREKHLRNFKLFEEIYSEFYNSLINRFNTLKSQTMKIKFPNGGGPRNIDIGFAQKIVYKEVFYYFRENLIKLYQRLIIYNSIKDISFPLQNIKEHSFVGFYYKLDILRVTAGFDFEGYFKKYSYEYSPFFNPDKCLKKLSKKLFFTDNYDFWILFIQWKVPPVVFDEKIYSNYTSPTTTIKVFLPNGEEVEVEGCDSGDEIVFYFPVNTPNILEEINNNKTLLLYGNFINWNSTYFSDPYYINDETGEILNLTRQERINLNYTQLFLTCISFEIADMILSTENNGKYFNYTYDSGYLYYLICNSTHLSDYMIKYNFQSSPIETSSRLYFISRYMIFLWTGNYLNNWGLYISAFIVLNFIVLFIILKRFHFKKLKRRGFRDMIELEYLRFIFPYGNLEEDYDPTKEVKSNKIKILFLSEENKINNKEEKPEKDQSDSEEINKSLEEYLERKENNKDKLKKEEEEKQKEREREKEKEEKREKKKKEREEKLKMKKEEEEKEKERLKRKNLDDNEIDPYGNNVMILKDNKILDDIIKDEDLSISSISEIEEKKEKRINNEMIINNYIEKTDKDNKLISPITDKKVEDNLIQNNLCKRKVFQQNLNISNEAQRLNDIKNINLTFFQFVISNLKNRHIIYGNLVENTLFYTPILKLILLSQYLVIINLVNTFGFINFPLLSISNLSINNVFSQLIICLFIPCIISNISLYILVFSIYISKIHMRQLVLKVRIEYESFLTNQWSKFKTFRNIYLTILLIILTSTFLFAFYLSFGLCAVYKEQNNLFFISFFGNILIDSLVLEIMVELFIGLLFIFRKKYNFLLVALERINTLRSYRILCP